ncbi:hypothetical protein KVR01_007846 [Diaporthe batatas]|uniref:uncharacterized protein n=1 Tax=Diaporthe batatas TaxID=748121 RepID=UPI001D03F49F|nr:uncharacterized protein KVR01_007846 [Diaporthe batatas]KAG8162081.1 hypothetical protein KVR01_007846 [Diaporthe batatas]
MVDLPSNLPPALSHWFGARSQPPPQTPFWNSLLWAFVGAFCGLSVLQAVFGHASYFIDRGVPQLVASYGASAVLIYGVPEVPLAQPRAVIGGHFISALVGLIILTIFRAGGHANENDDGIESSLSWLAASLASSIAIVCMMATKTTHPPAGATALIPIIDPKVYKLSWYFLPVVLLSSTLMVFVGIMIMNVQKRYPVFWWEPTKPPQPAKDESSKESV